MVDKFKKYSLPPTIQEREYFDPDDYIALICRTAEKMVEMNTPYTGKKLSEEELSIALAINIAGIKNGFERGTITLNKDKTQIVFWHPGKGEYVPYDKELQEYLLGFIGAFKSSFTNHEA